MAKATGFYQRVDDLVLARARRGELQALEQIYRMYERPVYTLGLRLCGGKDEADEVLQETFLEVVRSIKSYRGDGRIGAWLRQVTTSKALGKLRKMRTRQAELNGDDPLEQAEDHYLDSPRMVLTEQPERIDLERALARLPATTRVVVWLHDVLGHSHPEIATLMGRSVSFSKSRLARAHSRLRLWLGQYRTPSRSNNHASVNRHAAGATRR